MMHQRLPFSVIVALIMAQNISSSFCETFFGRQHSNAQQEMQRCPSPRYALTQRLAI